MPEAGKTKGEARRVGSGPARTRIFLVDDHGLIRMGLARIIEGTPDMLVCGEAADGVTALEKLAGAKADVLITDLCMPGLDGLEMIKRAKASYPDLAIIVLSMHEDILYAERAIRAGAKGYVMKSEASERIAQAVRAALAGGTFLSERVAHRLLNRYLSGPGGSPEAQPLEKLSDRELQVFRLLGEGLETRKIAEALSLGVKTVETHLVNIQRKLNLAGMAELRKYALLK